MCVYKINLYFAVFLESFSTGYRIRDESFSISLSALKVSLHCLSASLVSDGRTKPFLHSVLRDMHVFLWSL